MTGVLLEADNVGYKRRKLPQARQENVSFTPINETKTTTKSPRVFRKVSEKLEPRRELPESEVSRYQIANKDRVILNVGGNKHEILWKKLDKFPDTKLGKIRSLYLQNSSNEHLNANADICFELFFDCNFESFEEILNLYRRGTLHLNDKMCPIQFAEDLKFWGIDETLISSCCLLKFEKRKELSMSEMLQCRKICNRLQEGEIQADIRGMERYRRLLWNIFENSTYTSNRFFVWPSIFLIVLSTTSLTLSTMSQFQPDSCKVGNSNFSSLLTENCTVIFQMYKDMFLPELHIFPLLEEFCMFWFTVELLLRLFAARDRCEFFTKWLNVIDLVTILPFYISITMLSLGANSYIFQDLLVLRMARILKLGRFSAGLCSLGVTLKKCLSELVVLVLFISVAVFLFSSMMYVCERHNGTEDFDSIPKSFYWAVITMTTVGYGDVVPITWQGKVVVCLAAISGVVVIALPVAIIIQNFSNFYEERVQRRTAMKRRIFVVDANNRKISQNLSS